MKIIDAHMHLGEDLMFLTDDSEADLLKVMKENSLSAQIVQPGMLSRDQHKAHERIKSFVTDNPGRAYGITCFNPYMEEQKYIESVRWAIEDLGFIAIKLQPYAFCMAPTHPGADKIYRTAMQLKVPVMIHTGTGTPVALPTLILPVARKYPDLTIVMAHAGGGSFGSEALIVAKECPNVYLETSWTPVYDLKAMIESLGAERIMFGSDLLSNVPVELAKYRVLGLSDKQLEWCLGKTAEKVFSL